MRSQANPIYRASLVLVKKSSGCQDLLNETCFVSVEGWDPYELVNFALY